MADEIARDNLKLFESGFLSDVEVVCKERVWKLHKVILCGRSTWFTKALTGDWVESTTRKVTLTEMDPDIIDVVLRYLYSGSVEVHAKPEHRLEAYAQLCIHADFFNLDRLRFEVKLDIFDALVESAHLTRSREAYTKAKRLDDYFAVVLPQNEAPDLGSFVADLREAIKLVYTLPTARSLQKDLTACVFAMGTDFSMEDLKTLLDIPAFKADMVAVLADSRFKVDFPMLAVTDFDDVLEDAVCVNCRDDLVLAGFTIGEDNWCYVCGAMAMTYWLEQIVSHIPT